MKIQKKCIFKVYQHSLPYEVQVQMYKSVKGLENAKIMRPAYAIEYDCIDPTQLKDNS